MKLIRAKIIVYGRVQGVGFRNFVWESVKPLGLKGYTQNLPGGEVEIIVEGEEQMILKLIETVKKGNGLSKVDKVDLEYSQPLENFLKFEIKR